MDGFRRMGTMDEFRQAGHMRPLFGRSRPCICPTITHNETPHRTQNSPLDAVHVALAAIARVDFFVTCDDKLLNKKPALSSLGCKLESVLGFFQEVLT